MEEIGKAADAVAALDTDQRFWIALPSMGICGRSIRLKSDCRST